MSAFEREMVCVSESHQIDEIEKKNRNRGVMDGVKPSLRKAKRKTAHGGKWKRAETESDGSGNESSPFLRLRNDSSDDTHAECQSDVESEKNVRSPTSGLWFVYRCNQRRMGRTANEDMGCMYSAVAGWRAGLEVRGRGAPDGDDSEDPMNGRPPGDSRMAVSALPLNTRRMPPLGECHALHRTCWATTWTCPHPAQMRFQGLKDHQGVGP